MTIGKPTLCLYKVINTRKELESRIKGQNNKAVIIWRKLEITDALNTELNVRNIKVMRCGNKKELKILFDDRIINQRWFKC